MVQINSFSHETGMKEPHEIINMYKGVCVCVCVNKYKKLRTCVDN